MLWIIVSIVGTWILVLTSPQWNDSWYDNTLTPEKLQEILRNNQDLGINTGSASTIKIPSGELTATWDTK